MSQLIIRIIKSDYSVVTAEIAHYDIAKHSWSGSILEPGSLQLPAGTSHNTTRIYKHHRDCL